MVGLIGIVLSLILLMYLAYKGFCVIVVPLLALFKELGIPKRLIPAAIMLGVHTFTMTALSGTPEIQNAISMRFFDTDLYAASGLGVLASILIIGRWRVKKADLSLEGYRNHLESHLEQNPTCSKPSLMVAFIPIFIVIVSNLILTKLIIPSLNTAYLGTDQFGNTSLNSVIGLWAIICALVLTCLSIIVLNWKSTVDIKNSIQQSVSSSFYLLFLIPLQTWLRFNHCVFGRLYHLTRLPCWHCHQQPAHFKSNHDQCISGYHRFCFVWFEYCTEYNGRNL